MIPYCSALMARVTNEPPLSGSLWSCHIHTRIPLVHESSKMIREATANVVRHATCSLRFAKYAEPSKRPACAEFQVGQVSSSFEAGLPDQLHLPATGKRSADFVL